MKREPSVMDESPLPYVSLLTGSNQNDDRSRSYFINERLQWQAAFQEIYGTCQIGVDDSQPLAGRALLDAERQLFPVLIDHDVDVVVLL